MSSLGKIGISYIVIMVAGAYAFYLVNQSNYKSQQSYMYKRRVEKAEQQALDD